MDDGVTDNIPIKRDVKKESVMSPLLFKLYTRKIFIEILHDRTETVKVGSEITNNMRHADGTAVIAEIMKFSRY